MTKSHVHPLNLLNVSCRQLWLALCPLRPSTGRKTYWRDFLYALGADASLSGLLRIDGSLFDKSTARLWLAPRVYSLSSAENSLAWTYVCMNNT